MAEDILDVGALHEAVVGPYPEEAQRQRFHLDAPALSHLRHVFGDDGEQKHFLLERLVVAEVVLQDEGRALDVGGEEHRRAGNAGRSEALHVLHERFERHHGRGEPSTEQLGPPVPGGHEEEEGAGHGERDPTALANLGEVGRRESEVDEEQASGHRSDPPE